MNPDVGADIESICRKCGDVWHVVVAKDGDKIAKVQCKQCSGYHKYKAPADAKKPPKATTRRTTATKRKAAAAAAKLANPQVEINTTKPVKPYKFSESFDPGDRITHPKFGDGVVELNLAPGKMQVFFPEGRRILALAKKSPSNLDKPPPFRHAGTKPPPKW